MVARSPASEPGINLGRRAPFKVNDASARLLIPAGGCGGQIMRPTLRERDGQFGRRMTGRANLSGQWWNVTTSSIIFSCRFVVGFAVVQ